MLHLACICAEREDQLFLKGQPTASEAVDNLRAFNRCCGQPSHLLQADVAAELRRVELVTRAATRRTSLPCRWVLGLKPESTVLAAAKLCPRPDGRAKLLKHEVDRPVQL